MPKCNTYVAIMEYDGSLRFVTSVDNATRTALWEDGKPALALSETRADDLMSGLLCNGFKAVTVKAADFLSLANGEAKA